MGASYARDYPMKAIFNGHTTATFGNRPRKSTTWWGMVTAVGKTGDATEVKWNSQKGRPLTYEEAIQGVHRAMDEAEGVYLETTGRVPDRVTFSIECR
mgnify:CR=1 FL=1